MVRCLPLCLLVACVVALTHCHHGGDDTPHGDTGPVIRLDIGSRKETYGTHVERHDHAKVYQDLYYSKGGKVRVGAYGQYEKHDYGMGPKVQNKEVGIEISAKI